MTSKALRLTMFLAAVGLVSTPLAVVWAEDTDTAALARALKDTMVTLQDGLKASEREGKPLSGKFEIEHDALQLSVYTLKGDDFIEVVADPKTGTIAKAEKITDADDLKAAAAQKAAMAKATVSLLAAADAAVKANAGLRAVSIYPQLQNGHAVAEVSLLQGTTLPRSSQSSRQAASRSQRCTIICCAISLSRCTCMCSGTAIR